MGAVGPFSCPHSRKANHQGSAVNHDILLWYRGVKVQSTWAEGKHKMFKN